MTTNQWCRSPRQLESTGSQIKPIDRTSGHLLHQPHSAVDKDHHTNNGHARNSGKEQWIKHWSLHWPVLGLAPPGGHAKSENRPVALELPSAGIIWERLHSQTVDAFGDCSQTQPPLGSLNTRLEGVYHPQKGADDRKKADQIRTSTCL